MPIDARYAQVCLENHSNVKFLFLTSGHGGPRREYQIQTRLASFISTRHRRSSSPNAFKARRGLGHRLLTCFKNIYIKFYNSSSFSLFLPEERRTVTESFLCLTTGFRCLLSTWHVSRRQIPWRTRILHISYICCYNSRLIVKCFANQRAVPQKLDLRASWRPSDGWVPSKAHVITSEIVAFLKSCVLADPLLWYISPQRICRLEEEADNYQPLPTQNLDLFPWPRVEISTIY
jgi:hypothetical protein